MQHKIHLALIIGSDREGRFGETVARWVERQIAQRDEFTLDVLDPLELSLPTRITRVPVRQVQEFRERIRRADAYIVVTPEYNHGYRRPRQ